MKLTKYFFKQFLSPFVFGAVLFLFVLLFDKLFDLLDLIFNKGVGIATVSQIFILIIPSVVPLTVPMAMILACLVTFGRLSEENELTAVRAAGINLIKVLWLPPLFALMISLSLIPFNRTVAPIANQSFMKIYESLIQAEPLINIQPHKFFMLRNIRLLAESVDTKSNELHNVFVYQLPYDGRPADRIFARSGKVEADENNFRLFLKSGQQERFDATHPSNLVLTSFANYAISVPLKTESNSQTIRYRNVTSYDLAKQIKTLKSQGFDTAVIEAEGHLRYALAFAPFALAIIGIPLATSLKRGAKSFGFGVTIIVIFAYYLMLILGLTLAEKKILTPFFSLWIGNFVCFILGTFFLRRLLKK